MPHLIYNAADVVVVVAFLFSQGLLVAIELAAKLFVLLSLRKELLESIPLFLREVVIGHGEICVVDPTGVFSSHHVDLVFFDLHSRHIKVELLFLLIVGFWRWAYPSLLLEVVLLLCLVLALCSLPFAH